MFAKQEMNDLAERRRMLLVESALHRNVITAECECIRKRLAGLNTARERLTSGGPWLAAGGAVAGVLALRHWRKVAKWVPAAMTALRWVKLLKSK